MRSGDVKPVIGDLEPALTNQLLTCCWDCTIDLWNVQYYKEGVAKSSECPLCQNRFTKACGFRR